MQAQTLPKLLPTLRSFHMLDLIQEHWHSPNYLGSIDHLSPVRHQGIHSSSEPRCKPAG